jgi:hypothetical protein
MGIQASCEPRYAANMLAVMCHELEALLHRVRPCCEPCCAPGAGVRWPRAQPGPPAEATLPRGTWLSERVLAPLPPAAPQRAAPTSPQHPPRPLFQVDPVELERAKRAATSMICNALESKATSAEDIGRQMLTYGQRYTGPQYVEMLAQVSGAGRGGVEAGVGVCGARLLVAAARVLLLLALLPRLPASREATGRVRERGRAVAGRQAQD